MRRSSSAGGITTRSVAKPLASSHEFITTAPCTSAICCLKVSDANARTGVTAPFQPADAPDLYPVKYRKEIDEFNDWLFPTVNNGHYRMAFCQSWEAYSEAYEDFFESVEKHYCSGWQFFINLSKCKGRSHQYH